MIGFVKSNMGFLKIEIVKMIFELSGIHGYVLVLLLDCQEIFQLISNVPGRADLFCIQKTATSLGNLFRGLILIWTLRMRDTFAGYRVGFRTDQNAKQQCPSNTSHVV